MAALACGLPPWHQGAGWLVGWQPPGPHMLRHDTAQHGSSSSAALHHAPQPSLPPPTCRRLQLQLRCHPAGHHDAQHAAQLRAVHRQGVHRVVLRHGAHLVGQLAAGGQQREEGVQQGCSLRRCVHAVCHCCHVHDLLQTAIRTLHCSCCCLYVSSVRSSMFGICL